MPLEAIFRDDLLPIATTLADEAQLCCAIATEADGKWSQETSELVAFTLSSGMAQILHAQRAILLEVFQTEHAARVTPVAQ